MISPRSYALDLRAVPFRVVDGRIVLDRWTWPGGYPMFYVATSWGSRWGPPRSSVFCASCAVHLVDFDPDDPPRLGVQCAADVATLVPDVLWEGEPLECEECGREIESAYGPVEASADRASIIDATNGTHDR